MLRRTFSGPGGVMRKCITSLMSDEKWRPSISKDLWTLCTADRLLQQSDIMSFANTIISSCCQSVSRWGESITRKFTCNIIMSCLASWKITSNSPQELIRTLNERNNEQIRCVIQGGYDALTCSVPSLTLSIRLSSLRQGQLRAQPSSRWQFERCSSTMLVQ